VIQGGLRLKSGKNMQKISLFIVAVSLTSGCVEVADEHHRHHDRVYVDEPVVVEEPHYHHHHDHVIVEEVR
jgi:hypothetical protein